ncbi:MAG TPA: protein kinase [Pyrinomonadaceae bacterium]|jgi:serine/threonine-protein kinase
MKVCPKCKEKFENTVGFCPRDGEVLQESLDEMVGQVLDGQYEVEAFIAQGGMGAVYRARHILLGDRVVIKTLRSEMRHNSEWLRRFQREGRAARRFRHPNAVTVYDLRTTPDGLIYMVMEYVEGRTLDRELKARGRFSPVEAVHVLEPIADVLDAAHAVGVVHRDLKPENVMLGKSEDGRPPNVKLLDLGIAKMLGFGDAHSAEATSLTVAGQLLGTPYYMSPEQWGELPRDGGTEVDGRTDVYSLALIFYEMVAGSKPFEARTLADLRHKHVAAPVPELRQFSPDVPEEFSRALLRALSKDRNDRPATAGTFVNELRAALGLPLIPRAAFKPAPASQHDTGAQHVAELGSPTRAGASGRNAETADNLARPTAAHELPPPEHAARAAITDAGETLTLPAEIASSSSKIRTAGADGSAASNTAPHVRADMHQQAGASASHAASAHSVAAASTATAQTATATKRRSPLLWMAGAFVLLLVFVGVGVGGWLAWRASRGAETTLESGAVETSDASAADRTTQGTDASASSVEVMRYWIEAFARSQSGDEGSRIAAVPATLVTGQQFKLHFVPNERGHLYIISRGLQREAPMVILSSKSAHLETNLLAGGQELSFPPGDTALELDAKTGMENFVVVFSPQPLMWPSAMVAEVGHKLSEAEQSELEEFLSRNKANTPVDTSVKGADVDAPYVSLARDASVADGQPFIFEIQIEHR